MVRFKLILSTVPSDNELNQHALWICTEWDTHTHTHTHQTFTEIQEEKTKSGTGCS